MNEQELLGLLSNQEIVKSVNEDPLDITMATVLQGIVDKQVANKEKRQTLRQTLDELKDFKPQVSTADLEKLVGEFQQEAIKAYQRIASSTVSIIEGELSGLTSGVPGAFSFGDNPNKELMDSKVPFQKTKMRQYQYQIDDVKRALQFMQKECEYVKEALEKESEELVNLIDSDATFQFTGDVINLISITKEYIDVISDIDDLKKSKDHFTSAHTSIQKINNDDKYQSREWGKEILHGMISFATFACRVAESESDLNKINKVDGAGVVRRGLTRAFSDIITLDQKFYPDNNQMPIPPTSVSPVVVGKYLLAYKDRALELVTASYEQVNSINNKFDRQITTANRDMNLLSETMLMPKPAALSAAGPVIKATPTPEAFYSQTDDIPLQDMASQLEINLESDRLAARPAITAQHLNIPLPQLQHSFPPPPPPAPTRNMLEMAGSRAMMSNPRKRRRRKK